jgi:hypothetical protein
MKLFSSLTNRIFFASAALAVLSIGVAIAIVNVRVTREAEGELERGLEEAARLVEQHHETQVESSLRLARLVADLPRFKAAVDLALPPPEPLARTTGLTGSALIVVSTARAVRVGRRRHRQPGHRAAGIREALQRRRRRRSGPARGESWRSTVPISRPPGPEIRHALRSFEFESAWPSAWKALTESDRSPSTAASRPRSCLPATSRAWRGSSVPQASSRLRLGDEEFWPSRPRLGPPAAPRQESPPRRR